MYLVGIIVAYFTIDETGCAVLIELRLVNEFFCWKSFPKNETISRSVFKLVRKITERSVKSQNKYYRGQKCLSPICLNSQVCTFAPS